MERIAMLRDGSPVKRQGMTWLGSLLLLACGGSGLLVASLRPAQSDEPQLLKIDSTGVDWRRYVDANAPGYVVLRPAVAMALPSMEQHRVALNRIFKDECDVLPGIPGLGVQLDSIECFAGPVQITLQKNEQKGTGSLTVRGQVLRFTKESCVDEWIKHCTVSIEKIDHKLGVYYRVNQKPEHGMFGSYLLRPDTKTIVFAESEKEVLGWLENLRKPTSGPSWLSAVPQDTGIVTAALNMQNETIRKMLVQIGVENKKKPVFKPFLEHRGSVACTVAATDHTSIDIRIGCASAETAAKKKDQLDPMLLALKMLFGKNKPAEGVQQAAAEQQALHDLIINLQSSLSGSCISYRTHCSLKLGEAMKEQMVQMTGRPRVP